jgi:hypothetical protein
MKRLLAAARWRKDERARADWRKGEKKAERSSASWEAAS